MKELADLMIAQSKAANSMYQVGWDQGYRKGLEEGFREGVAHAQKLINEKLPRELFERGK